MKEDETRELVEKWKELEDYTIKVSSEIINRTENELVKLIFEEILHASKKHRKILDLVAKVSGEGLEVDKGELQLIADLLADHERIENESINLAYRLLNNVQGSEPVGKIVYHLLNDEWKHHAVLKDLLLSLYTPDEKAGYL